VTEQELRAVFEKQIEAMKADKIKDLNWTQREQQAEQYSREMGLALLSFGFTNDPRTDPEQKQSCAKCQRTLRVKKGRQQRPLVTPLGVLTYKRPYAVCDGCGYHGAPLDEALGIPKEGSSIGVVEKVCDASVVGRSFKKGGHILRVHSKIHYSDKQVRVIAEKEGRRLAQETDKEVGLYRQGRLDIKSEERPQLLVVTMDGGRVQSRYLRGESRWREDKVAVVYDAMPRPSEAVCKKGDYEGAKAKTKTYAATMKPWEEAGWLARLEAERRGYNNAKARFFISDGAESVRTVKNDHFPEAVFGLDWYHAAEHVANDAKAAFGEGTQEASDWYEKHKAMLWDGKRDALIADIQELSRRAGSPRKNDLGTHPRVILYRDGFSYFPNNHDAIDYPGFRAKGWPIGSGVVEGGVKQFGIRLKGSEMFWNIFDTEAERGDKTGAEEMLALCALHFSEDDRWRRYWDRRAQPQKRE